ncbi:MAG: DEAD/DEAH box helicase family protein [Paludibacteraceae bacterium]|nr:DEAD/DEAH box helicase family protein [Paludibacteraceae bacterium]
MEEMNQLRQQIADLREENRILKELLKRNHISFKEYAPDSSYRESEQFDPNQSARIIHPSVITEKMAVHFYARFWGREDVFALRYESKNTGKSGYALQCHNRWNDAVCPKQRRKKQKCQECIHKDFIRLEIGHILAHLQGKKYNASDVVGVYPLLPNDMCRFLVFDFDNHSMEASGKDFANEDDEWREEVDGMRKICEKNGIMPLVERSRSGRGAHLWIFFQEPVPASLARRFGFALLEKGAEEVNLKSFKYYDRMLPAQDHVPEGGVGNLIALPLQGKALKEGNSAFIDENWNAYPDQWWHLFSIPALSQKEIEENISEWSAGVGEAQLDGILSDENGERLEPWKTGKKYRKSDVSEKLLLTISECIYVDTINLRIRLQNQIRRLALVSNPQYYKNRNMGRGNFDTPSRIYLGEDEDGYIKLPRGLLEILTEKCKESGIEYEISDNRQTGTEIHVEFQGELREEQKKAVETLSGYDNGILHAATAFGKTVVCCALIAEKKVNTLILLESSALIDQWMEAIEKFLNIEEEMPTYKTKTGRVRVRKSLVGKIHGAHDSSTGIIDIAMVGSLCKKGEFHERLAEYGCCILDECHHAASDTIIKVLSEVRAKYVYGVTATPKRGDGLEKINEMLLGPVRFHYTSKERALAQGIRHLVYPRFTRTVSARGAEERKHINEAYEIIRNNAVREDLIISDIEKAVKMERTPIILSRYKDLSERFYERLKGYADHVFIMTGNNKKEHKMIRKELLEILAEESIILVATGQLIGEGFDMPRLDTLFLATPVSGEQIVDQYAGRLHRDYEGKKNVIIYDYVDRHIREFDAMYTKRLKAYKKIGYELVTGTEDFNSVGKGTESESSKENEQINAIYDYESYHAAFEKDLVHADKSIVISSPVISRDKIQEMTGLLKDRQIAGVSVTIVTWSPDAYGFGDSGVWHALQEEMRQAGFVVQQAEEFCERYTVIDDEIVWYGSMNFLGREDVEDNLMRVCSKEIAAELMEMTFGGENDISILK